MSHISKIELQINDLTALKQACNKLGLEFVNSQRSFKCFNGQGNCEHAIKVPGARYEVGIVKNGNAYELLWDDWYSGGLVQKLGKGACNLKKQYSLERVKNEARKKRYNVREQKIKNGTRLVLTTA